MRGSRWVQRMAVAGFVLVVASRCGGAASPDAGSSGLDGRSDAVDGPDTVEVTAEAGDEAGAEATAEVAARVTWENGVAALMTARCTACHAGTLPASERSGAPGHSNFDTYEATVGQLLIANDWIQLGKMPPGQPMSSEEKALFSGWVLAGAPR